MQPLVSVVLGSYNRRPYLEATLENIRAHGLPEPYEIIVVDGGSTDGALEFLTQQKDVITIVQHNRGEWRGRQLERRSWGYFMNLAFRAAGGRFICMVSDDCLLVPGAVTEALDEFQRRLEAEEKIGAMAFYFRDWPVRSEYYVSEVFGYVFVNHGLFLREALQAVDFIDADTYRFYFADADLCLRLRDAGYSVIPAEASFVEHHYHANPNQREVNLTLLEADAERFLNRWRRYAPEAVDFREIQTRHEKSYLDDSKTAEQWHAIDRRDPRLHWFRARKALGLDRWLCVPGLLWRKWFGKSKP